MENTTISSSIKRTRNNVKQSKFGCLTCKYEPSSERKPARRIDIPRKRRVKCDETKPSCRRCLFSKVSCLGYPIGAPPGPSLKAAEAALLSTRSPPRSPTSSLDRYVYLICTVLSQGPRRAKSQSEISFWSYAVPQMIHSIPAVHAAAAAFGASYDEHMLRSREGLATTRHYHQALRLVQNEVSDLRNGALPCVVACLLMAFTETLQQRSDRAYMHLQGALAVMAARGNSSPKSPIDGDGLSTLFEKLNLHSVTYATSLDIPVTDRALYSILHASYRFISSAFPYKYAHPGQIPSNLLIEQGRCRGNLQYWLSSNQLNPQQRISDPQNEQLLVLRMQCYTALIYVSNALQPFETAYDNYALEFQEIIASAKAVLDIRSGGKSSNSLPLFTPEMGIIQPLFFATLKYRNSFWRKQALNLLRKSGREGPWCGAIEAQILDVVIAAEENTLDKLSSDFDEPQPSMPSTDSLPTLVTLFAGLQQVVDATPRYCPPYGPVLPAPRQASQHLAVQYAVDTITTVLKGQTGGFNLSGVSVGVKSIYEDEPLLDFHYTPSTVNPKEGARKINASTVYRLGSISKVFTVLAALRLAEDGVLSMNDPMTRWIPELAHRDGSHSRDELDVTHWTDITVGDAAAHLSGLGGDNFLNIFKSYRPPVYQPSQSPVYSNAGISLVGLVVEAASNKTFDAAIRDLVLKPLRLEQTYSGIVPENSENMFIPAGSPDWDADIGIFAPAGAMGSSTADMLSSMTSILKNKALSPSNTRRWLKPNTFTSTWSASVGSPWEIYRVDNLTSDGRIIDIYTKGGTLSGYQSGMAMIPDTGLVVSVLGAGPEVSSVWAQLATLNIVEALIPAMDMAARDEAKARFAGQYVDKETGSALMLSLDNGPGLVLSNWTARDFDVLPNLNRFQPGRYNDTADSGIKSVRLYPTGIENKSRAAWRAVFPTLSDTEAEMIEGLTKVKDVTCITWHMLDRFIYNGLSMDHFEFQYGKDGKAVSIKSKAFDIEMKRVEKKA
ncbi:beta-lactamase/transpeptidase-like protein [Fusarium oxysporum]|nr:beta-lactamase/transpeptidase-like protein [Fusarium oxysporum]